MSSSIIVNLKGNVYLGTISEFIANKYNALIHADISQDNIMKCESFTGNISFKDYKSNTIIHIFYYYTEKKDRGNLEYFKSIGLEEMVLSDTTYLSSDVDLVHKDIMKSIVEEFGGWICFDDQFEGDKYYYFRGKRNIELLPQYQSLYEQYATNVQPFVLASNITLQHAINCIRSYKNTRSVQFIGDAIDIISHMFNLSYEEVRDAVDGKEYWVSIAGMYDTK